ncbi:hypothetical protein [Frateuria soli]|uniref:hypothetical protein n=1 Tax=Frateuria soli TaxID=1542730 RepID=UPI001E33A2AA|nr:hypothetical protein [Frateuria soli]UGB37328.1 hypothetical protein LQ771_10865 [Frateuria soli]
MKLTLPRLIAVLLGAGLMLTGCAGHPTRSGPSGTGPSRPASQNQPTPRTRPSETPSTSQADHGGRNAATGAPEQPAPLPESTGIPACDNYLASYVACHRAAAIYKPGEIQGRYEAMRTSLLRDAQDPAIRPNLATRCNSLASQLRQALHGKSCEAAPTASGTSSGG